MKRASGVGNAEVGAPAPSGRSPLTAPIPLLLAALEQFRQRQPGRYGIRHFDNCTNAPGRMLAEVHGPVPCSVRCIESRRAVELAGGET